MERQNYTSAAIGVIGLIATVTWFTTGQKQFTGPESGGVVIEGRPHIEQEAPVSTGEMDTKREE